MIPWPTASPSSLTGKASHAARGGAQWLDNRIKAGVHSNGQASKAVGQLGHASIQTTLNIYTHVADTSHRRAIEQLEGQFSQLFPNRAARPTGM